MQEVDWRPYVYTIEPYATVCHTRDTCFISFPKWNIVDIESFSLIVLVFIRECVVINNVSNQSVKTNSFIRLNFAIIENTLF